MGKTADTTVTTCTLGFGGVVSSVVEGSDLICAAGKDLQRMIIAVLQH